MGDAARGEILAAIRAANAGRSGGLTVPRAYRQAGGSPLEAVVALLVERLHDYRAAVHPAAPDAVAGLVARLLREAGAREVGIPPGLPSAWRPTGLAVLEDGPDVPATELDRIGHALTGCALAIAETGSLVLDHGPDQGRRALSLVPDHHVCVVRADQVVETIPEAIARMRALGRERAPITIISGPSATSDIELRRVEGVHGPRRLDVIVIGDRPGAPSDR